MKSIVLKFGLLALAIFVLLQLSRYSIFYQGGRQEFYIALFAVVFLGFGFGLNRMISQKRSEGVMQATDQREDATGPDLEKLEQLGISKREYEVLQLIAKGLSNQEIAGELFISESTVKTHVSNLLQKLDAKRRTQAVNKAKAVNII